MAVDSIPTLEVGTLTVATALTLPAASIGNAEFSAASGDKLAASKIVHQQVLTYRTASVTTTIANVTQLIYVANGAGVIRQAYARNTTAPTGGTDDYTIEIKKASAGSSSFSTVLSSAIASGADNTKVDGTISSSALVDGDALQVIVLISGSGGTQGIGLSVFVVIEETH